MSDKIDDGGPAFPQNDATVNRINNLDGMSLRDWFAGMALQRLLKDPDRPAFFVLAKQAYQLADWMLKERAKHGAD